MEKEKNVVLTKKNVLTLINLLVKVKENQNVGLQENVNSKDLL